MTLGESMSAGLMMTGLVLGAMTGTIAVLLILVAAGAAGFGITSWYRASRNQKAISSRIPYPPYGY